MTANPKPETSMKLMLVVLMLSLLGPVAPAVAEESGPWVAAALSPQYFAVSVEDVDRSVDWYRKALGLRKLDDTTADDGRWRIANLVNDELFVEIIFAKTDKVVERARGFAKVGFRVADVNVVADRVAEATGERPRVLDFDRHGVRLLQLRDPDGNIVQLTSPLPDEPDEPDEP